MTARLTRDDLALPPQRLARALLGARVVRVTDDGERLAAAIVETEAYLGAEDRAAHSFNLHRSPRNESMYGPPGTLYVYFTYGMHHCMNVVCGVEGRPVAVLLRAAEPLEGIDAMRANRLASPRAPRSLRDTRLCAGPARLCQALAVDRALDGEDLTKSRRVWLEPAPAPPARGDVARSPRIGVGYAGEWAGKPLRWFLAHSPHVSR
jgi:DNA-3-methyladenine glycosylase